MYNSGRFVAVIVAFAAIFILGFAIHMPQTSGGVNFGVFAFPIYAARIFVRG